MVYNTVTARVLIFLKIKQKLKCLEYIKEDSTIQYVKIL